MSASLSRFTRAIRTSSSRGFASTSSPELVQVDKPNSSKRVYNFSAGPAMLPTEVMNDMASEFTSWQGCGMGMMEISHRDAGGPFQNTMSSATSRFRSLLNVPDNYKVLFFQGGAHGLFASIPLNIATEKPQADYLITGYWSERARDEAAKFINTQDCGNASDFNFTRPPSPDQWNVRSDSAYVHLCANETIAGIEYLKEPELGPNAPPLIMDATSTLLSRPMDISKYGMVYASGGKNIGPAGIAVAIIRDDLINDRAAHPMCPSVLDFSKNASSAPIPSIYNTPPTYLVYAVDKILGHVEKNGGCEAMGARAERRAGELYSIIDQSGGFYVNNVEPEFRSRMNVVLRIGEGNEELEAKFCAEAEEAGMFQLFKHPLFRGLRVTLYNGLPDEAADAVAKFMRDFQRKYDC